MKKLVIVGAGGHGVVCAEIAEETGRYDEIVFSDERKYGTRIANMWLVEYRDSDLGSLSAGDNEFILGVGQTGLGSQRQSLYDGILRTGLSGATIVSPDGYVSTSAELGAGSLVGRMAVVQPGARIGTNVIVNTRALVEHDAHIGDHCHVSTGAILNGGVSIGHGCLVGSGAVVLHGVSVCDNVIIGAGAVLTCDISNPGTYVGVPARKVATSGVVNNS